MNSETCIKDRYDIAIIGVGIAGRSFAYELGKYQIEAVLIEKENDVSVGMTKANSAIVHGGYDSLPGSKMAKYNVAGSAYIKGLREKLDTPYRQIGALIVAFLETNGRTLEEPENHGIQNGVKDMKVWGRERLHKEEPHVSREARTALYLPNIGIVSPWELALALAEVAVENGIEIKLNAEVKNIEKTDAGYSVKTNQGVVDAVCACNAAGVFADEVNKMMNDTTFKIEPSKGECYLLDKSQGNLVSHVIFQCPDGNGKGVLVAPIVHGNLIIGPDSQPTSREDVSTTAEDLSHVHSTVSESTPDINFRESTCNFAGVHARTREDDFSVYENPENRLFYNIAGVASPSLSSAPVIVLGVTEMMRESGLPLTRKEACMDTRDVVRFREMNHEERTTLTEGHFRYGKITCRCEAMTEGGIIDTVYRSIPAVSADVVRRRYDVGMGRCQSGFCSPRVQEIIARGLERSLKGVSLGREGMILIIGETEVAGGEQE